jgi:hypothetical protein
VADLSADLRWLFESGAVSIDQLATLHSRLGVTSAARSRHRGLAEAVRGIQDWMPESRRPSPPRCHICERPFPCATGSSG